MLTSLSLSNYRGYQHHNLELRPLTLIVGANNAGKSTLLEALILIALAASRCLNIAYESPPKWLGAPARVRGFRPSLRGMDFNTLGLFFRYGAPPAQITATFNNGTTLQVYVGPDAEVFAVIEDEKRNIVTNRVQAQRLNLPPVSVMPQIGPLLIEERRLTRDYVIRNVSSRLASHHFRNQLAYFPDHFTPFSRLAEQSWPGLRITGLEGSQNLPDEGPLALLVQDGDFVAEIGWMGHGLQMWLQVIWFLARTSPSSIVILDEPDVYMHPDLQRRLIRLLRARFRQVIVTTHSTEMMGEVSPDNILVIDRSRRASQFVGSLPAVQTVIDRLGGTYNVHLSRLWQARRFLLVEGKDVGILKSLEDTLFPNADLGLGSIPSAPTGGWSQWRSALTLLRFFRQALGDAVRVYAIIDRDYHTPTEINEELAKAQQEGVELHVWQRKELENYLVIPDCIQRVLRTRVNGRPPAVDRVREEIDRIAETLKEDTFNALSAHIYSRNKSLGVPGANREARETLNRIWGTWEGRISTVSGKELLARLSDWSQREFGASFSPAAIARSLGPSEIDPEIRGVLSSIEHGEAFPTCEIR